LDVRRIVRGDREEYKEFKEFKNEDRWFHRTRGALPEGGGAMASLLSTHTDRRRLSILELLELLGLLVLL
jgi:hypothetical protein